MTRGKCPGFCGAMLALCLSQLISSARAQDNPPRNSKPEPDFANVSYGPHERNVMDVWRARTDSPAPLLVFIHGGGFHAGSKEALSPQFLSACLARGISVASVNYRLSPAAKFPDHFLDCARAIQFARLQAGVWNIDPARVAASGGSAGAGTSLWIGFHDDLADPGNSDPVLRQSTRLSCMVVYGAQSTYDPRVIKEIVGGRAHEHPALTGFYGIKENQIASEEAFRLYEAASPINYLTRDDPPVLAFYSESWGPLPDNARPGEGIHHPNFGKYLKEKMDALGVECQIRHADDHPRPTEAVDFLVKYLKPVSVQ